MKFRRRKANRQRSKHAGGILIASGGSTRNPTLITSAFAVAVNAHNPSRLTAEILVAHSSWPPAGKELEEDVLNLQGVLFAQNTADLQAMAFV